MLANAIAHRKRLAKKRTGPCNGATVARLRRASLRNVCSSAVPNRNGTPRDKAAAHRATRESRFCAAARVGTISLDCAPAPSRQAHLPEGGRCIRPCLDTPPTQSRRKASLLSLRNLYVCFLSIGNRIRRTAHCSSTNLQRTGRRKRRVKNGEAPRVKNERPLQAGHGRAARKATNRPSSRNPCEHDQGRGMDSDRLRDWPELQRARGWHDAKTAIRWRQAAKSLLPTSFSGSETSL